MQELVQLTDTLRGDAVIFTMISIKGLTKILIHV